MSPLPDVPLRRRLFLLAAVAIVPLAAMSGLGLLAMVQQHREQAERAGLDVTRALATAVDAELRRSTAVLETLATSLALDAGDTAAFNERARRVMAGRPHWRAVILADARGKVLVNTGFPSAGDMPQVAERASFDQVLQSRQPVVGSISRGPRGEFGVPVRVPVVRGGELRYVLTGVIRPEIILEVLKRQRVPDDWVVSVFDANGLRVARSRAHDTYLAMPASPSLQQLLGRGVAEGSGVTRALEGDEVYSAFTRLADSGWTVAIGVPVSIVQAGAMRSMAALGGGLLLSLAIGTLAALWVARSINRPIAKLRGAAQALGRGDAASVKERSIIERQVAHLRRLVDDLLDVSRITKGKITLQHERVDMNAVVARSLELTQPALEQRARSIEVDLPGEPLWVVGDAVRLTQVLCNLLGNAAKFTPADGRIALRLRERDGLVEVVVEDEGSGIAPELLSHVFDLFMQGEQPLDRHAGGLGLGLAIVKTLVHMHGGSVSAASDGSGRGSVFTVRLPAANSSGVIPIAAIEVAPVTRCSGRILVVDDNVDAAETLAQLLRDVGYEVRTAPDGAAALALVDSLMPDLAMADIGPPGMDGYELAPRLRADSRVQRLRLVARTGYGREPDRVRALQAQFDEHLVKPVAADRLLEVLRRLLESATVA